MNVICHAMLKGENERVSSPREERRLVEESVEDIQGQRDNELR